MSVQVQNPHLEKLKVDYLYHFMIDSESTNLKEKFGDTRFVIMGGSEGRMAKFAKALYENLKDVMNLPSNAADDDLAKKGGRYCMFKVGPALILNHGMGFGSLSIAMHEVIKMLHYAGATNVSFLRLGTCGGVGQTPGTICITEKGYTQLMEDYFPVPSCGEVIKTKTDSNPDFNKEIIAVTERLGFKYTVGNTVATNCFYEGQGRLDGAFCDYDEAKKMAWLNEIAIKHKIVNFEMESALFLSMTNRAKVRGACACVALVNRLNGDQITNTKEEMGKFVDNLVAVVIALIRDNVTTNK